jgi:GNAT superfamily N-acetyltransferase
VSVAIREATIADAPALGAVQMAALLAGYAEFLETTAALPGVPERVSWWRAELELPDTRAWIAEHDGNAAGLVSIGPGELRWLCVMPERWRGGIGTALLATAEQELPPGATLEVPEASLRARRLFERRGWTRGEELGQREGRVAPEVRYRFGQAA